MNIIWSADAVAELQKRFGENANTWKLVYDTEGCGCAVNGVPVLWAVSSPDPDDQAASGNPFTLWYNVHHAVFFDDVLKIGFDPSKQSFSLSSDNQIYTTRLLISDHRSVPSSTAVVR